MSASIHQEVIVQTNAQRIYAAMLTSSQFSAFTGGKPTEIDAKAGGAFSCFGGMISGRIVELVENRRIVQAWRAGNWPEGVYSIVRFELEPQGSDTKIIFDQSGFPPDNREHLEVGWHKMYWEPLKAYLA
jgi:activator of HSP90 ATPase